MPDLLVRSFAPLLLAFQPCFTRPNFSSFWALTCGWILCSGKWNLFAGCPRLRSAGGQSTAHRGAEPRAGPRHFSGFASGAS